MQGTNRYHEFVQALTKFGMSYLDIVILPSKDQSYLTPVTFNFDNYITLDRKSLRPSKIISFSSIPQSPQILVVRYSILNTFLYHPFKNYTSSHKMIRKSRNTSCRKQQCCKKVAVQRLNATRELITRLELTVVYGLLGAGYFTY